VGSGWQGGGRKVARKVPTVVAREPQQRRRVPPPGALERAHALGQRGSARHDDSAVAAADASNAPLLLPSVLDSAANTPSAGNASALLLALHRRAAWRQRRPRPRPRTHNTNRLRTLRTQQLRCWPHERLQLPHHPRLAHQSRRQRVNRLGGEHGRVGGRAGRRLESPSWCGLMVPIGGGGALGGTTGRGPRATRPPRATVRRGGRPRAPWVPVHTNTHTRTHAHAHTRARAPITPQTSSDATPARDRTETRYAAAARLAASASEAASAPAAAPALPLPLPPALLLLAPSPPACAWKEGGAPRAESGFRAMACVACAGGAASVSAAAAAAAGAGAAAAGAAAVAACVWVEAGLHHTPYDGHRMAYGVWTVWGSCGVWRMAYGVWRVAYDATL
jgi:hypothetical protein